MTFTGPRREDNSPDFMQLVDASGGDWLSDSGFGHRFGVASELNKFTKAPVSKAVDEFRFDPRSLRAHDMLALRPDGVSDRRFSIQTFNDFNAEYEDVKPGHSPYAQDEFFTADNRSTREADGEGRVALPSSFRRIVDSEDGRYALSLVVKPIELGGAGPPEADVTPDPEDPNESIPRTLTGDVANEAIFEVGGVSQLDPNTGEWVPARTGPPAGPTETADERFPPATGSTRPRGKVGAADKPGGYVSESSANSNTGVVVGLLGTVFTPSAQLGFYSRGREGTPIGPCPIRHDAQFAMGGGLVGRIRFTAQDVAAAFDERGLGAIVNSSRGIIFAYQNKDLPPTEFAQAAQAATVEMKNQINSAIEQSAS